MKRLQALAGVDENPPINQDASIGVNAAMKALNAELSDLSIEQQNSLAIAKIRQRAAREGRELIEREIEQIERLAITNNDSTSPCKNANWKWLCRSVTGQVIESISAQQTEYDNLNQTVIDQTMGLTAG